MQPAWYKILFRTTGKPRAWTRLVLFRKDRTARTLFYRVIHTKSGKLRPHWAPWASKSLGRSVGGGPTTVGLARPGPEDGGMSQAEQALLDLRPFDQTISSWIRDEPLPTLMSVADILERLEIGGAGDIVLSASHDNYRVIPGGVQLCIQREEAAAMARGLTYLQFHPWQPLPCLAPPGTGLDLPVSLVLNGTSIGTTTMATLTEAAARCVKNGRVLRLVVHHLLGHSTEAVANLADAARVREVPFWLHDFFSLCPSYTLRRNELVFCGAPDASSNACGLCVFGQNRVAHQARIAAFFDAVPVMAVAPSVVTANFWSEKSNLTVRRLATIPHVVLDEHPREEAKHLNLGAPITVGFLGAPLPQKGWTVFAELMSRYSDLGIRFVVCSASRPGLGEDDWQRVHVTADYPDAMSRTVEQAGIDIVVHWATWPETFSFTTYEAMSAGAWVVTNPGSGNVQATVAATGRGAIVDDQAALDRLFADGGIADLVAERRACAARTKITARYSALSFDLPGWT